jgi:phage baseplate assembly protein V
MGEHGDTERMAGDIARLGVIASVDRAAARCTVKIGDAVSGPIPWLARACGPLKIWAAPVVGEQVLIICPDAQLAGAVAVPGIFSTANPAPASDEAFSLHFGDGAVMRYDPESSAFAITLPAEGSIEIIARGGISIEGDVAITGDLSVDGDVAVTGKIEATGDVIGQGKNLATHRHTGVQTGAGLTGQPQ